MFDKRELPGLSQIRQGHFEVWDWSERFKIDSHNWAALVKEGSSVKLSFIMGTWHGLVRNKCIRCFKPLALTDDNGPKFNTW
jgi:hypothetical protein